jgi:hypothetical protein
MRWLWTMWIALAFGPAPGGEAAAADIGAVLQRSQQRQLDALTAADPASPRARRLRANFELLMRELQPRPAAELRVVAGGIVAETMQGHIVVAHETLGDLPQGEQLFVLAHELGHVVLGHWLQNGRLYRKWVPGAVTPQTTDPVAGRLGSDASALAWRQEFEADAFGVCALLALGRTGQDAVAAFMHLSASPDTVTHPGTQRRVAAMRAIDPVRCPHAALSDGEG